MSTEKACRTHYGRPFPWLVLDAEVKCFLLANTGFKMEYIRVRTDNDPKVVGSAGVMQVYFEKKYNPENFDMIADFFGGNSGYYKRENKFPDFEVYFNNMTLEKGAKLSDFMSYGPLLSDCFFLISNRAMEVFSNFKLTTHRLYPCRIFKKHEEISNYQMFHCPGIDLNMLDYKNSAFVSTDILLTNAKTIQFKNQHEHINYVNDNSSKIVQCETPSLVDGFDPDVFSLSGSGLFLSKKLWSYLSAQDIKGLIHLPV